jgi:OmpR family response regulator RpaB
VDISNKKILVVDKEAEVLQLLEKKLTLINSKVILATNGEDALIKFIEECPDLVILDIILPDLDGFSVCREIRESSEVPIIFLTAITKMPARLMGFKIGVDDYVTKPFSPKELKYRIRALLRRTNNQIQHLPKKKKKIYINNLVVDRYLCIVLRNNLEIKLTSTEYNLLKILIEHPGKKLSRPMLLDNVWGCTPEHYGDTRIVDVYISRLRSKIEDNPSRPNLIITVRGLGYMFQNY